MQWIGEKQKQVLVGLLPSGRLGAGVECPGAEKGKSPMLLRRVQRSVRKVRLFKAIDLNCLGGGTE